MHRATSIAAVAVAVATTAAIAKPSKLPFDGLFRANASWRLPCEYGTVDHLAAHGELACAIDDVATTATSKRAHLACSGQHDILGDIEAWALEPRTLVATDAGLWSVDDDGPDGNGSAELAHVTDGPPLLAASPSAGKRRRDDEPHAYRGMWFVTSALDNSWCVAKTPWGWGGGIHVWIVCVSLDGAITGVAGFKQESALTELRCGRTPDPLATLAEIRR